MKKTDLSGTEISIDGVTYTLARNTRYSTCEFWTVFRDGKKFATVEWVKKEGWIGTFSTTGLRGSILWMCSSSPNCSIEKRIAFLHEANKEFNKRLIIDRV